MADVVVVGGENPVFIREAIDKVVQSFSDSDKTVYYGDDLNLEDFFSDLMTGSLFSARRMILIRNTNSAKSDFEKQLLPYLKDPSDSVCLVLEYQNIPTKIQTAVSALGNQRASLQIFKKAWEKDQKLYARRRLDDKGISCSAIDLLVSLAGEDIEELSGMLDKLISYAGDDKKTLNDQDVHHVLERVKNASIFDLTDAIFTHDRVKALQSLQDLLHAGESFPAITAMFYRSTKIMWAVKTSREMPKACSPYEWKKYQNFANKNNLRFLSLCFDCIHDLEWESKTKPEMFTQLTFEKFLCSL